MQLDTAILDMLLSLGEPGGPDPLEEILDVYEEDGAEVLGRLEQAAADGDAEAVRRCAHRLKGSSANVGAKGLADRLARIERAAPAGVTEAVRAEVQQVRALFAPTLAALRAYSPNVSR